MKHKPNKNLEYAIEALKLTDNMVVNVNFDYEEEFKKLPTIEGQYNMTNYLGNSKRVEIKDISSNHFYRNFHVVDGDDCYALSVENECNIYTWELFSD